MSTPDSYRSLLARLVDQGGLTQVEIAQRLKVTKATVHAALHKDDAKAGWVPQHPVGERLLSLYRERIGEVDVDALMERRRGNNSETMRAIGCRAKALAR